MLFEQNILTKNSFVIRLKNVIFRFEIANTYCT